MTKSELVDAIAAEAGLSKADSERALKACSQHISPYSSFWKIMKKVYTMLCDITMLT